MNVNQKIENALADLVDGNIWPLSCPLETPPERWITYLPESEALALEGDDDDLEWIHYMQVHWFAKGKVNYMDIRKDIRKRLRAADFSVTDIDYMYEKDTGITHLIFMCNILEEMNDGEM